MHVKSHRIAFSPAGMTAVAGKRVGGALYLHTSAVAMADPAVRQRIEHADLLANRQPWNVAKVESRAVSLLLYESFDEFAFPALLAAARVDLDNSRVVRTDYSTRENPPILHRKETLLCPNDPRRLAFAALTRLAEEHNMPPSVHHARELCELVLLPVE
jgi:hypothetical protein